VFVVVVVAVMVMVVVMVMVMVVVVVVVALLMESWGRVERKQEERRKQKDRRQWPERASGKRPQHSSTRTHRSGIYCGAVQGVLCDAILCNAMQ
jgi:Flp pilus assembly protein TadB